MIPSVWSFHTELLINFPSLCGSSCLGFHYGDPDTVVMLLCFLFLMASAIVVTGRAAGGTYLKVKDIVGIPLMTVHHATRCHMEISYSYGLFCLLLVLKQLVFGSIIHSSGCNHLHVSSGSCLPRLANIGQINDLNHGHSAYNR